jgi:hypothetical protein
MDPEIKDDVQGSLKTFLENQANTLQKKLKRVEDDITEYLGGIENRRRLGREDFDSRFEISCRQWQQKGKSSSSEV